MRLKKTKVNQAVIFSLFFVRGNCCKAILDGNYDKALKTISDRIKQGEKISSLSDNLEGRALQGDWEMAKSLARQRLELGHT